MKRIYSIDFTRGVVMIIMALDHVRDLMHINSVTQSPTDLLTTTPALFFTRWITYLCAPTFVLLAGTSAYIAFKNKGDISQRRKFLFKRGVWLILLELTVFNFGLYFDPAFHRLIFEVIAAIGFGFIILSLLPPSSSRAIGIAGLIIIFCHNLFPLIPFAKGSAAQMILSPFFSPGFFPVNAHTSFLMAYPPIPWLGIMLAGFGAGKWFEIQGNERKKIFLKIGCSALLLFVIIRFINIYGDPFSWASQKNGLFTFLSFMDVTKYPPSLLFCLITLGIMFFILAFGEIVNNKYTSIAAVYGKVPLFYFIIHFYLVHAIMVLVMLLQGFHWSDLDFASGNFGRPMKMQSGLPLWAIYLIWMVVVLVLYKPCLWFGKYKSSHNKWWLKYI